MGKKKQDSAAEVKVVEEKRKGKAQGKARVSDAAVSVPQVELTEALGHVARALSAKSFQPVLTMIRLAATDDGGLSLAATDLESSMVYRLGAKVNGPLALCVPGKAFVDLIGALDPDLVALDQDGATLRVTCGRFKANVKGIAADEFPILPERPDAEAITVRAGTLATAIDQVTFASAKDESRPVLTGVLVKIEDDALTLVAADGFRLSLRTDTAGGAPALEAIVPAKALDALYRFVDKRGDEPVRIGPGGKALVFACGPLALAAQTIDARYPDHRALVPASYTTRAVMATADLLRAVKVAEVFARENCHTLRFTITPATDDQPARVGLNAASAESGDSAGWVDAQVEGVPLEIVFSSAYLKEALMVVGTEQVALELTAANRPGLIRPVGPERRKGESTGGVFLHVVMPMHVNRGEQHEQP